MALRPRSRSWAWPGGWRSPGVGVIVGVTGGVTVGVGVGVVDYECTLWLYSHNRCQHPYIASNEDVVLIIYRNRISPVVAVGRSVVQPRPLFGPQGIVSYRSKSEAPPLKTNPLTYTFANSSNAIEISHSTALVWTVKRS